jgi:hypothetical protein
MTAETPNAGPLEKAYLLPENGDKVSFLINPKEFSIKRQIEWKEGKQKGVDLPSAEFGSGKPRTLNLSIFADTYEKGTSVDEFVKKLEKLALVDASDSKPDKKRWPPYVRFGWGMLGPLFRAVITQFDVQYTMFFPNGVPARATITIALKEVKEEPPRQNPTSGGDGGRRSHRVLPGETLDLIAFLELGSASKWTHLAQINGIDNPFTLRPGELLVVTNPE